MNVEAANFEDLFETYFNRTDAKKAASQLNKLIRSEKSRKLAKLLRSHEIDGVYDLDEIYYRAATDQLLIFISVLEVASLVGFIGEIEPSFAKEMLVILEDQDVRRYYEEFYPTRLPQLLRERLLGNHRTTVSIEKSVARERFLTFLEIDRQFMKELEDGYLTRMLDGFYVKGVKFDELVELISVPDNFIGSLLLPAKKYPEKRREVLSKTAKEFIVFVEFCLDLESFLSRSKDDELLQSAVWNHYSYWFEIIGEELRSSLGAALEGFSDWRPIQKLHRAHSELEGKFIAEEASAEDDNLALISMIGRAEKSLDVLTSRKFCQPIVRLLDQIGRPEPGPQPALM